MSNINIYIEQTKNRYLLEIYKEIQRKTLNHTNPSF